MVKQMIVFCPDCKGKQVSVQIGVFGPDLKFEDGKCPMCHKEFSGWVLPNEHEPGTDIPKIKLEEKKKLRFRSVMQPI